MESDEETTPEAADAPGLPTIEEAADDLMDRFAEIEGIAHAVDRALYHEEGAELDRTRYAVRGIMRLADLAGEAAMALGERLAVK